LLPSPASPAAVRVSSMSAQGLSLCELIRTSAMYSPLLRRSTLPHSTGPSPSDRPFGPDRRRHSPVTIRSLLFRLRSRDSVPEYRAPIRLLAPHRPELRSRLYPHLPPGGSRPGFAFPVARPFVCECRTIPAIPAPWTIPGLPESLDALPHRVARTHLGATGRNPNAFAPIVRARPFPVFGRPVHLPGLLPLITTRWFSSSLSDPASRRAPCPPEGHRWWLQVSLSVSRLSPSCLTSFSIPSIPSGR
jgi:hypothetical protein